MHPMLGRRLWGPVLVLLTVAGCGGTAAAPASAAPTPTSTPAGATVSATGSASATATPRFDHIYVLVMENEEYGSVVGSAEAPFLNGLIAKSGLATEFYGVAHPSQPNYLALFSGSTQGVTDDGVHNLAGTNLADQLEAHGRTWSVFAQDYPGDCSQRTAVKGDGEGIGKAGDYARKHNPAISFTNISGDAARCARITNFTHFDPTAADFELIVPNMCNDMHSCSVADGDAFLAEFVPKITSSPAFARSVLFITFDEGATDLNGGGRIAAVVVSPTAKAGYQSSTQYDHYSLLRTIEDNWGLGCLGQSCNATGLDEFFK